MNHQESYPGAPRWVKVFGIILIILVLLVMALRLMGHQGGHGPGRHMPSRDDVGQTAPASANEEQRAPEGVQR